MEIQQIADDLGINRNAVDQALSRAHTAIRRDLPHD